MAHIAGQPALSFKLNVSWANIGHWWKNVGQTFRRQSKYLAGGVFGFSVMMYLYVILNPGSVTIAGVAAAFVAVCVNTIQTYSAHRNAVMQGKAQPAAVTAVAVSLGVWAILTCAGMLTVVVCCGFHWRPIDTAIAAIGGSCMVAGFGLLLCGQRAWGKLVIFGMKVIWQVGQALLLLAHGTGQALFIGGFIVLSLLVGLLRTNMAREAYLKTPRGPRLSEAEANLRCWRMDVASFIFMAFCLVSTLGVEAPAMTMN